MSSSSDTRTLHDRVKSPRFALILLGALLTLLAPGASLSVSAQPAPEAMRPASGEIALLVVEEESNPSGTTASFWWQEGPQPRWTTTDRRLVEAARQKGLSLAIPADVQLSRVYRTDRLSDTNAAQLARLIGARRALVGRAVYRELPAPPPLKVHGVVVDLELRLVDASSEQGQARSVSVRREAFAPTPAEAREEAAAWASEAALAEVQLSASPAPAAPASAPGSEVLIGLRNVEKFSTVTAIRQFLETLGEIKQARERLAMPGLLALEINPDKVDDEAFVLRAVAALEAQAFEGFRLVRLSPAAGRTIVELRVEYAPAPAAP